MQTNIEMKAKLLGSFLLFARTFFTLATGRDFNLSNPAGRESHFITIAKHLTKVKRLESLYSVINISPGSGKSTLLAMWTAWCMAHNPKSQFLYISYSHELAAKHVSFIKRIISCPEYQYIFGIEIDREYRAKDYFKTTAGGSVKAFGSAGSITGHDAGLPGFDGFSGAIILDDMHKPDEAHSDTMRERVIRNYQETIVQRLRSPRVPIVCIGQRVHEDDICAFLLSGKDEKVWDSVVLKSIDDAGNAMYPEVNPLSDLLEKKEKNKYTFSSQYQQEPVPAGDALYRAEDFVLLDEEPEILQTFITVDTAETSKSYNDASAFSFFGVYKIEEAGQDTGLLGLHWLDCWEVRVEPRDLEETFKDFYAECMMHRIKPKLALIEKKSTGVTLLSTLQSMRGISIRDVARTKASGSKADRYIEMQSPIASKLISFTRGAKHVDRCVNHMVKITANDGHAHDDVCHAAGSMISTMRGSVKVEDVRVGDKVITPLGVGAVSACGISGYKRVIRKAGLHSTPDHQVYTFQKGFVELDTLNDDDKMDKISFLGLCKWRLRSLLFLMEKNTRAESRESIIEVAQESLKIKRFIKLFMNFIVSRKYRKAMMFIIKMAIAIITVMKIWSVYRVANTRNFIAETLIKLKSMQKNGIKAKRVGSGTERMQESALKRFLSSVKRYASSAIKSLFTGSLERQPKPVACGVTLSNTGEDWGCSLQHALYAEMNLPQRRATPNPETEKHAVIYAEDDLIQPVYAITVEKYGVYYCNNVLLRNCDTLYDAVKLALIDKSLYFESRKEARKGSKLLADALAQRRAAYGELNG